MTYYTFTGHCEWHLFAGFNWRNETGCELQRGAGSERDHTAETRDRHFVFMRMRRNFRP